MKKDKKIIILFFSLLICIMCFCGCSTVSYSMVQYSNGEVLQAFSVSLDKNILEQNGYDFEIAKQKVESVLENVVLEQKERFLLYDNISTSVKEDIMSNGLKTTVFSEENNVYVQMLFSNVTSYRYFYNLQQSTDNSDKSDYDKMEDFLFFKKIYTIGYTKYYNFYLDPIYNDAVQEINDYFRGANFSLNDVKFNYCYATPRKAKLYSNADYTYFVDDLKMHIWQMDSTELDRQIEFYQILVKPTLWYILALGLTLILIVVMLIVIKIKGKIKKKPNKNVELLQNNIDFNQESDIINE